MTDITRRGLLGGLAAAFPALVLPKAAESAFGSADPELAEAVPGVPVPETIDELLQILQRLSEIADRWAQADPSVAADPATSPVALRRPYELRQAYVDADFPVELRTHLGADFPIFRRHVGFGLCGVESRDRSGRTQDLPPVDSADPHALGRALTMILAEHVSGAPWQCCRGLVLVGPRIPEQASVPTLLDPGSSRQALVRHRRQSLADSVTYHVRQHGDICRFGRIGDRLDMLLSRLTVEARLRCEELRGYDHSRNPIVAAWPVVSVEPQLPAVCTLRMRLDVLFPECDHYFDRLRSVAPGEIR